VASIYKKRELCVKGILAILAILTGDMRGSVGGINGFAKEMPDQFILNTVGTKYIFTA
jgi:hypothetical protein